jgi:phage tail sheath gpL-like
MTAIEMAGRRRKTSGDYIPEIILIVGQYDQTKTAVEEGVPFRGYTADEFGAQFGFGSEIHRQAIWIFQHLGGFSENVYAIAVPEPGSSAAATGTVTFSGTATSAGTHYLSIGGDLYELSVAVGDTDDEEAAALVAAITANKSASVSAAAGIGELANVVTITAKNKGVNGNQIRIVSNPAGTIQSNKNPAGIALTLPATGYLTTGAGNPDVSVVFFDAGADKLGDRWYTIITCPYQDATALAQYKLLGDARFNPAVKRFFASYLGYVAKTYSEALALPATINSKWISPVWENRSLVPDCELGAAVCGLVAASAILDPGRPFKTLELGIPVDDSIINRSYAQNDALYRAGMGYCKISSSGALVIGDLATSYRTTGAGASTEEWFDALKIHRRQEKAYSIERLISSAPYDRAMLGSDDIVTGKSYVIKPKMLLADLVNLVDFWASQGWTKNPEVVKASIVSEINTSYSSRLDAEITDDPAEALRIIAIKHISLYD